MHLGDVTRDFSFQKTLFSTKNFGKPLIFDRFNPKNDKSSDLLNALRKVCNSAK